MGFLKFLIRGVLWLTVLAIATAPVAAEPPIFDDPQKVVLKKIWQVNVPITPELPGAFSGLYFDRTDGLYWTVTDSGRGTVDWPLYLVRMHIDPQRVEIRKQIPITEGGRHLTGADLDPEDVAVGPDGSLWLCDESGPWILHLNRDGKIIERIAPPQRFIPTLDPVTGKQISGCVRNQGFEGVAVSSDGGTVFVILQSGLFQEKNKLNTWILAYDVKNRTFKEYPYRLDDPTREAYPPGVTARVGANGLATIGENKLLVIERDNQSGDNARIKRIYFVSLPEMPPSEPVAKKLLIDMYQQGYRDEKLESIAVRDPRTLVLMNDNDFKLSNPTTVWLLLFESR